MAAYQIKGRVIDPKTNQGISKLKVELWIKEKATGLHVWIGDPDDIDNTKYNEDGTFILAWRENPLLTQQDFDIFFKVYMSSILLTETQFTLVNEIIPQKALISIQEIPVDSYMNQTTRRIHGFVLTSIGEPVIGKPVRAFNKTFQSEVRINAQDSITDQHGYYSIIYYPSAENRVNIVVKVFNNPQTAEILVSSPLILNAKDNEEINLSIGVTPYTGTSEFSIVSPEIEAKLEHINDLSGLGDREFALLSNEIKIENNKIYTYIQAKHFAQTLNLNNSPYTEVFYGLLKVGAPNSLNGILLEKADKLNNFLNDANERNIINISTDNSFINQILLKTSSFTLNDENTKLNKNLSLTGLDGAEKERFILKYNEIKDSITDDEALWDEMLDEFGSTKAKQLRCAFELSYFTKQNEGLTELLYNNFNSNYENLSSFADILYDKNYFIDLMNHDEIKPPVEFESIESYAQYLVDFIERKYPTKVLVSKIQTTGRIVIHNFNLFISNNQDFEFGRKRIEECNIGELSSQEIEQIKKLQRLFVLAPINSRYEVIERFWTDGITSASDITKIGQNNFISKYEVVFNSEILHGVYSRAFYTCVKVLMSYAKYGRSFNAISTYAFNTFDFTQSSGASNASVGDIPELEKLFGSLDYCNCSHCQSVQSASAYLVDLLLFINDYKNAPGDTNLYEALNSKRTDIPNIELNCKNTSTLVPYIDLVNEVLESKIVSFYGNYQTMLDSDTIKAYPEHLNQSAYSTILSGVYPWTLPFDLWAEEGRSYLGFMNTTRGEIMERFAYENGNNVYAAHSELDIAIEKIGLSQRLKKIICGETIKINNTIQELKDFYGCNSINDLFDGLPNLKKVKVEVLLNKTKLEFTELKELLTSRTIHTSGLTIEFENPNTCDLSTATIPNMGIDELDNLHRYYRLKSSLKWSVKELDLTLKMIGVIDFNATPLSSTFIAKLSKIKKLNERYNITIIELLAWWSDMDKDTDDDYQEESLYSKLFLNKSVANPPIDPLIDLTGNISGKENIAIFEAACNLTGEEILELIAVELVMDNINLQNISQLFRISSFCKYNKIKIADYIQILAITNFSDVFSDISKTLEFIDQVDYLKNSPLAIDELGYLLNDYTKVNSKLKPPRTDVVNTILELKAEIRKKRSELILFANDSETAFTESITISGNLNKSEDSHFETCMAIILNPNSTNEEFIDHHSVYFKNQENAKKRLIPGSIEHLSDIEERKKYFIKLHKFATDEELNMSPDQLEKYAKKILEKVIIDSCHDIVSGDSVLSKEEKISIIEDQANIYKIEDAADKLVNEGDNFISSKRQRFESVLQSLEIPANELKLQNLRHILSKTFESSEIEKIVQFTINTDSSTKIEHETLISSMFGSYMETQDVINKLADDENEAYISYENNRIDYLIDKFHYYHLKNLVINFFATKLDLPADIMQDMLEKYTVEPDTENPDPAINVYLDRGNIDVFISASFAEKEINTYYRLYKASIFVNTYNISAPDAKVIFNNKGNGNWFDIFYGSNSGLSSAPYPKWINLNNAFKLQRKYFTGDLSLFGFIDTYRNDINLDDAVSKLSEETYWSVNDINNLTLINEFTPSVLNNEEWILQLSIQFELLNRIGVSAYELAKWNKAPLFDPDVATDFSDVINTADAIRRTAKAHYDNKQWLKIAEPLRNQLRKKQRDALVAYMIGYKGYEDVVAIYDGHLLDPEMEPCALTSRIVQATLSIQLFIQRILLNLEEYNGSKLLLSEPKAEEWKWRKNYRLWEANRRVFLTPENWLEPELRMDKSPMFKIVEEKLTQADINEDNVKDIYLNYLNGLEEVAKLDIVGMYEHKIDDDLKTLYVIGRTPTTPHKYYHRSWEKELYWTPWQYIDVEIDGDHILPVYWDNQLFIYWPIFIDKAVENRNQNGDIIEGGEPLKYFEIKLAWTRFKDGKWAPKKVSASSFDMKEPENTTVWWYKGDTSRYNLKKSDISLISYWAEGIEIVFGYPNQYPYKRRYFRTFCSTQIKVPNAEPYFVGSCGAHLYPATTGGHSILYDSSNNELTRFLIWYRHEELKQEHIDDFAPDNWIEIDNRSINFINNNLCYQFNDKNKFFSLPQLNISEDICSYMYENELKYYKIVDNGGNEGLHVRSLYFAFNNILFFNTENGLSEGKIKITIPMHNPKNWDWRLYPWMYLYPEVETGYLAPNLPFFADMINCGYDRNQLFFIHYRQPDPGMVINPVRNAIMGLLQTAISPCTINISNKLISLTKQESDEPTPFYWSGESGTIINRNLSEEEQLFSGFEQQQSGPPQEWYENRDQSNNPKEGSSVGGALAFRLFEHPFVGKFVQEIQYHGIESFFKINTDHDSYNIDFFAAKYVPTEEVHTDYPIKTIDFSKDGPYSVYNWELFFHIPLMIANRLSQNNRFEEAMKWYHHIFDPTTSNPEGPQDFWKFKPFFHAYNESGNPPDNIIELFENMDEGELNTLIEGWMADPFNPHSVAQGRIVAYMMNVLMKYLDNLISWGDLLFNQDNLESLNEATLLYLIAYKLLGRKPVMVDKDPPDPITFEDKKYEWDLFGNTLLEIENVILITSLTKSTPPLSLYMGQLNLIKIEHALTVLRSTLNMHAVVTGGQEELLTVGEQLYFCIPANAKLLSYWDVVADRLFKLRNCMNVKGIVRQLPLFQPPIDPSALIKAKAAGIDLASALSDMNAPLPIVRFKYNLQKALELTTEVKSLGGALLSALEKKDSEDLAVLRVVHQEELFGFMVDIKKKAIEEAQNNIDALTLSKNIIQERLNYYSSRKYISPQEQMHLDKLEKSMNYQEASQLMGILSGPLALIPSFDFGVSGWTGTPIIKAAFGGPQLSQAALLAMNVLNLLATMEQHEATKASIKGGYDRRMDDWQHQASLAKLEIPQIDKQIAGAELRLVMAEKELENLQLQIEQANTELEFMQNKFTNKELYNWMITQVSTLYFQTYQMAYDQAKKAEKAYRFELGKEDTNYIQFGYWDSLKKGLLSGEKLHKDLQRMDIAYMNENTREYEITKHLSLAMLNPDALIELRETGTCWFEVPEVIYDLDYPGQYFRRIKSVSITIPAVTGPYTNINCRLSLINNRYRKTTNGSNADQYPYVVNDERFVYDIIGIQSIATSGAQNDSGMFQFDFKDERYLPFEGAGAIGRWSIEMPNDFRQFDYDTISDVILHINYTSKEGGGLFKQAAIDKITTNLNKILDELQADSQGLLRMFSLKAEFANELHQFLNPESGPNTVDLKLSKKHFPYFLKIRDIKVNAISIYARSDEENGLRGNFYVDSSQSEWEQYGEGNLYFSRVGELNLDIDDTTTELTLTLTSDDNGSANFGSGSDDIWLLIEYTIANPA
jgi:hypothetical protein